MELTDNRLRSMGLHLVKIHDPFVAEQFEWLLQWLKLNPEENDMNQTDLQVQLLSVNSHNQRITLKLDKLKKQLKNVKRENQVLQADNEKLTYDIQYVSSQKEQLAIERDGMVLHLEEQEVTHQARVRNLEEQISSMQLINAESEQQISIKEEMRKQVLNDLKTQEQVHIQEMDQLRQSMEYVNQDNITCSICLVEWGNIGSHRLVSLACGHLYGASCIVAHLSRSLDCPICRQPAHPCEIRHIYGRDIIPPY